MWSIVTEKNDLVKYFWSKSRLSIASGLAIASICQTVIDKTWEEDTREDFRKTRQIYENLVIDIYSQAWDDDWENAERLLGLPIEDINDLTLLDLAEISKSSGFIGKVIIKKIIWLKFFF